MTNPTDPAFSDESIPKQIRGLEDFGLRCRGLTKREYFAAMAMQGMAANPQEYPLDANIKSAVAWADALVAELNKYGAAK